MHASVLVSQEQLSQKPDVRGAGETVGLEGPLASRSEGICIAVHELPLSSGVLSNTGDTEQAFKRESPSTCSTVGSHLQLASANPDDQLTPFS